MTPERMAQIHALCFRQPRPWTAREFTNLLGSDSVFICKHAHGFALGRVAGPEVELLTIAVDPAHRREGLGYDLMVDFATQAKANDATDVFLEVAENNDAATGLYRRLGFSQAGFRKDYYAGPKGVRISALVMTKRL